MATEPAEAATAPPGPEAVDWAAAARRARRLARPGPDLPAGELTEFVAELRQSAKDAPAHVGVVTGLLEPALQAGAGPVYVLDRPRWAEADLAMLRSVVGGVRARAAAAGGARTN